MRYETVDLTPYMNSALATYDTNRKQGQLNAWGNSLPAEELPFGTELTVDSVPFRIPDKLAEGDHDNVEPLEQEIELKVVRCIRGIALLCCGEMGDQYLTIQVSSPGREPSEFVALAKGFSVLPRDPHEEDGFHCSHLHYPGDYDLDLLTGTVWCFQHRWEEPVTVSRLKLGLNPLFHLMAISLVCDGGETDG